MYSARQSNDRTGDDKAAKTSGSASGAPTDGSSQEEYIYQLTCDLEKEKARKGKLYSSVLALSEELKELKDTTSSLLAASAYANRTWYDGGLWRGPELLPDVLRGSGGFGDGTLIREPVSLTDLFLDLVIVTAFSRVGETIQVLGSGGGMAVNGAVVSYFLVFWLIWEKESSYATRFDTTDLSSQAETLLTCFAVLFGSLSVTSSFDNEDCTRIMVVAAFVALLHFCLHFRVAYLYRDAHFQSDGYFAKKYAIMTMVMTFAEFVTWIVGIAFVSVESKRRWVVFLVGILLSLRVPKAFISNDFHAASSKRGVLFILLLGYALQNMIQVAGPFFDYLSPSLEQYLFLGAICFILFCIKLLYVDDTYSIDPRDHALLVNRIAAFFFNIGQFLLLMSTTTLWAGLNVLTHNYFAGSGALSNNAKSLVSGGFAAVIFSILFIKSMHIRRIPLNPQHEKLFYFTYTLQLLTYTAIITFSLSLCFSNNPHLSFLTIDQKQIVFALAAASLLLVAVSWMDEAIEARLYGNQAEEHRVQPFGFWTFMLQDDCYDDILLPHDNTLINTESDPLMRDPKPTY
eukprot:CAMPEP_0172489658 /NCGR_PEP_ID=MMETSP1066-20121228/19822_1 /TAXON_ID=671091 /ORGANISM="Coscinodiscus wailesii, Strain CCMP2513" /LENGTH=571 /DNA_ID=CAMNT_0013257695 /DNA_START=78 /DNA_END=1793 /DNA_ORIENTATION=+